MRVMTWWIISKLKRKSLKLLLSNQWILLRVRAYFWPGKSRKFQEIKAAKLFRLTRTTHTSSIRRSLTSGSTFWLPRWPQIFSVSSTRRVLLDLQQKTITRKLSPNRSDNLAKMARMVPLILAYSCIWPTTVSTRSQKSSSKTKLITKKLCRKP